MPGQGDVKPTIVLVHGVFADASSWNGVIKRPQQPDYPVAPENPLHGPVVGLPWQGRALALLNVSA